MRDGRTNFKRMIVGKKDQAFDARGPISDDQGEWGCGKKKGFFRTGGRGVEKGAQRALRAIWQMTQGRWGCEASEQTAEWGGGHEG